MTNHAFGRRPPKGAPALSFAAVREAIKIPDHPPTFDSIAGWGGWDMLGNDTYGDCVAVTWATIRRIVTRRHTIEHYPNLTDVLALYKTQNPSFDPNSPGSPGDGGMDIQTVLEHLVKVGGPDGVKALAFAKLDHTNIEEIRAAIATFDFVWLGVNVSQDDEQEFPDVWSGNDPSPIVGGHSITGTGYTSLDFDMETWADEGLLDWSFMADKVQEAWVVIWPEHAAKMNTAQLTALNAAFKDMTGHDIDWGTLPYPPVVTPVPVAPPVYPDVDADLLVALREWLSHAHSSKVNKALVDPAKAWVADQK